MTNNIDSFDILMRERLDSRMGTSRFWKPEYIKSLYSIEHPDSADYALWNAFCNLRDRYFAVSITLAEIRETGIIDDGDRRKEFMLAASAAPDAPAEKWMYSSVGLPYPSARTCESYRVNLDYKGRIVKLVLDSDKIPENEPETEKPAS